MKNVPRTKKEQKYDDTKTSRDKALTSVDKPEKWPWAPNHLLGCSEKINIEPHKIRIHYDSTQSDRKVQKWNTQKTSREWRERNKPHRPRVTNRTDKETKKTLVKIVSLKPHTRTTRIKITLHSSREKLVRVHTRAWSEYETDSHLQRITHIILIDKHHKWIRHPNRPDYERTRAA